MSGKGLIRTAFSDMSGDRATDVFLARIKVTMIAGAAWLAVALIALAVLAATA